MDLPAGVEEKEAVSNQTGEAEPLAPQSPSPQERLTALIEVMAAALMGPFILLFLGFILLQLGIESAQALTRPSRLLAALFLEAFITLAVIALMLGAKGQGWSLLNPQHRRWGAELRHGVLLLPLLLMTVVSTSVLLQFVFPQLVTETNPVLDLIRSPLDLAGFMVASVVVGGVKEEIQRAFILRRFDSHLGGALPGLIIWSVIFGFGHLQQGPDKAIQAAVLGLVFGLIYIRRGHLGAPMASHSLYDLTVLSIFWFWGSDI